MSRPARSQQPIILGIDIGGTFTDVVMLNTDTGEQRLAKVPSTPRDQSIGFAHGIEQVLKQHGVAPESVAAIYHGTTVATNLILESKGASLALITNRGLPRT